MAALPHKAVTQVCYWLMLKLVKLQTEASGKH